MRVSALLSDYRQLGLGVLMLACLPCAGIAAQQPGFPSPSQSWLKEGLFAPPGNVRMILPGMTKRQVRSLLGVPHFNEGLFGVRTWNYILNFYEGGGPTYRICQFQLQFDHMRRVAEVAWRSDDCARILAETSGYVRPDKIPDDPVRSEHISIHFEFGNAALSPAALTLLSDFARSHAQSGQIEVIGHTDSAGSGAHNDVLSLARADSVARALEALGVPSDRLTISGRGERDPVTPTQDNVREPANRRTDVIISYGNGRPSRPGT
jgi:OmpA-OmpF porin, OOP family